MFVSFLPLEIRRQGSFPRDRNRSRKGGSGNGGFALVSSLLKKDRDEVDHRRASGVRPPSGRLLPPDAYRFEHLKRISSPCHARSGSVRPRSPQNPSLVIGAVPFHDRKGGVICWRWQISRLRSLVWGYHFFNLCCPPEASVTGLNPVGLPPLMGVPCLSYRRVMPAFLN